MSWGPLRRAARLLSWGVADQAASSITNFAVNIYIARELGAIQYGAFSLAYVTYSFALNASRGLATDPLLVRFSYAELPAWRRAVASCTGTAVNVGLLCGTLVLCAAMLLSGSTRGAFLALGLTLPGLMLQDSWRFAFFALGRGSQAFLNDCVWVVALAPALLALRATGHSTVFWYVFAWGAAGTVAAVVGPLQARVIPRLQDAWGWLLAQRDLGLRYFAEGTTNSAATQLRNYGIGFALGLAALGYVQAASTLMGPFMVVITGAGLIILPEATRIWRDTPRRIMPYCMIISVSFTVLAAVWGVVLLVALPRGLGQDLLGAIWKPSYPLVLVTTLSVMGICATAGAGTGLHATGSAKRSLRAAVITSVLFMTCSLAGAFAGGTAWAVRGYAIAAWLGAAVYWWQMRAAIRESGRRAGAGGRRHAAPRRAALAGEGADDLRAAEHVSPPQQA
jgi:O-antigen/teichoic acid export membrane protein